MKFREQSRFLRGIVASVGFRQEAVLFDRAGPGSGNHRLPAARL